MSLRDACWCILHANKPWKGENTAGQGVFSSLKTINQWGSPSTCQYTDGALVINLSFHYLAPTTTGFLLPSPPPHLTPSPLQCSSSSSQNPFKPAGHPDSFICQSVLLTQWIEGPPCVMQIALGYRGDRRQQAIQGRVKTQPWSLLFYRKTSSFLLPLSFSTSAPLRTAFSQLRFQPKPRCIQQQALSSASQLWQDLN